MTISTFTRSAADLEALEQEVRKILQRVQIDGDNININPRPHGKKAIRATEPWLVYAGKRIARIFGRAEQVNSQRRTDAFITVIMPAHNEQKDIMPALVSLIMQTRPADRIVVVVNGTTDKTAELAGLFAEEFPGLVAMMTTSQRGVRLRVVGLTILSAPHSSCWGAR